MWLRGDLDNRAYFPNELGTFDLSDAYDGAVLVVEGPDPTPVTPRMTVSSTAQSSGSGASSAYQSNPPPPSFKSVIPRSTKGGTTTSIKLLKAAMTTSRTGKIDFQQNAQMHIDVSESAANVDHILREVQQKWGEGYVLVTLELEDCEGTRGGTLCVF